VSNRWQFGSLRESAPRVPVARHLVIKIGGSLLARRAWADDIIALVSQIDRPALVVVGGGRIVDALRRIDATAPRSPAVMHRLAIDSLGLTSRLVADALGLPLTIGSQEDIRLAVLDTPAWLDATDADGSRLARLPVGWHVTSDSIAALVATVQHAGLLLAKSVPPPSDVVRPATIDREAIDRGAGDRDPAATVEAAARTGWVDDHFPTAAAALTEIAWAAPGPTPP